MMIPACLRTEHHNYMLLHFSARLEKGKRGRSDIPVAETVLIQFSSVALNFHTSVHVFPSQGLLLLVSHRLLKGDCTQGEGRRPVAPLAVIVRAGAGSAGPY